MEDTASLNPRHRTALSVTVAMQLQLLGWRQTELKLRPYIDCVRRGRQESDSLLCPAKLANGSEG